MDSPMPSASDRPPHTNDAQALARNYMPANSSTAATMVAYRAYRDSVRKPVLSSYTILGFLSSGTYGRVYKARLKPSTSSSSSSPTLDFSSDNGGQVYAIKKFKPDSKETEPSQYTGISQSAMREIALNRELNHENIITLREVLFEDKAIYMVFEYAEHDLLQIIHHHSTMLRSPIGVGVLKSLMWQLVNGVSYLHNNWVLHRDLKPANILVTAQGVVKIGDLGLARLYNSPLQSLYNGDKVVVTIWYRAPELLLGARHYTTAIDMWAVGCIWGELLALRPMFKGEEAKMDPKTKAAPFQTDQLKRIVEILGTPNKERWPGIETMPDYKGWWPHLRLDNYPKNLARWYTTRARSEGGYDLFNSLLQYDPTKRLTADEALNHPWLINEEPRPTRNAFVTLPKPYSTYPLRRLIQDDTDPKMKSTLHQPNHHHHQHHHHHPPPPSNQQQQTVSNSLRHQSTHHPAPASLPPPITIGSNSLSVLAVHSNSTTTTTTNSVTSNPSFSSHSNEPLLHLQQQQ